jgi:CRP/FNR family cyclic AMP-dependent transcriptional regulator
MTNFSRSASSTFDPKAFLATVRQGRSVAHYAKDSVVYCQAAIADAVFYLQEGRIKISVASPQGKDAIIAILEAGAFFGEGCLIGPTRRSASAVAMVDSKVMRVAKAETLRLLREEPMFDELFIKHLLLRSIRAEEDLVDQLFNSSEKRLARALLLLANVQKDGGPQPIATKVSQETLAELIGTTRPRVTHFMTKFRKLGFISSRNGNVQVHGSLLNVVLRDDV